MSGARYCIATATTEGYLPGTVVTVASFLAHHPGFDGDVVVIHDDLSEAGRQSLLTLGDNVRLLGVSAELQNRLQRLGNAHPRLCRVLNHLHALEAYRLADYAKVLLLDGDLLFQQPIDELFRIDAPLVCCPDWVYLAGKCRDLATFKPVSAAEGAGRAVLDRTFNDGVLMLDRAVLGEQVQAELLALAVPETWNDTDTPHFKQLIHNRYFAPGHQLASSTYNYILGAGDAIARREDLPAKDAKVLHFNMPIKPWQPRAMLAWLRGRRVVPEFALWYEAWMAALSAGHLRDAQGRADGRTLLGGRIRR